MQVVNYKEWLIESKLEEVDYRAELLKDPNKMTIHSERLVFHREDEYIVWESQQRIKYYFVIDHEDELNGKYLKYVGDVDNHKRNKILKEYQSKIDSIGKSDGYGRSKISIEEIKEMCQTMFNVLKRIEELEPWMLKFK